MKINRKHIKIWKVGVKKSRTNAKRMNIVKNLRNQTKINKGMEGNGESRRKKELRNPVEQVHKNITNKLRKTRWKIKS